MFDWADPIVSYTLQILIPVTGAVGLVLAYQTYVGLLKLPDGNERMREIAAAIREGALAYLARQFKVLVPFILIVFLIIWASGLGFSTGIAYMLGSLSSLLAGFLGMKAATAANVRAAQAASENNPAGALDVAFRGGSVMGLSVASLGILGFGLLFLVFGSPDSWEPLVGFGMGASSVALFARVGGGIYTKAADVGSDLVGKVEAGIPEDDPRNPGVIADNVGDNVGDVAGMGADIYESFVACLIGCVALAATASDQVLAAITNFKLGDSSQIYRTWLMLTPVAIGFLGAIASYVGSLSMSFLKDGPPDRALRGTTVVTCVAFLLLSFLFLLVTPVNLSLWFCIIAGAACGVAIGLLTEYYTGSKPVYEIIDGARTGPATCVIAGIAVGFRSVAYPLVVIVLAVLVANYFGGVAGAYGVALAGVAMLSLVGNIMTIDAYGPIADNAGGISEMAELGKETRAITDKLDALGNTTAAIGKGFAIGASGLTALALFAAYAEVVKEIYHQQGKVVDLSITNPQLVVGVFLGAILPALIVAFTMKSVGKAAGLIVLEIRRQFREIAGLLEGKPGVKPDVQKCVDISAKAALSEMLLPGIVAITAPVLVGLLLGAEALGGLLLGTTVVGVVVGMFMSNAGGAWDNAKKFIEQGLVEGEKKGTDAHKAAVVGDTVGDPFKDTSGPAVNILMKMVAMLALLIAPLL
jgi:K(+)-stimulated pyrophosphate-energized sodium pump